MSRRRKITPHETFRLWGRNIYTVKRKRTIYYDWLTKQGYLVQKQHENRMLFFKNRFVVILFAAILCAGTFLTWMQAILAGVITLVLVEVYFRLSYLKKMEVVQDVDFERRVSALKYIIDTKSRGKVMALAGLYLAFSVLIVLNAYLEQYSLGINVLSVALGILGLYCCILHLVALSKMK